MKAQQLITKQHIDKALSYAEYFSLVEKVTAEKSTTGLTINDDTVKYTELNYHRMKRLNKTIVLNTDVVTCIKSITTKQVWLVITESWCGDAAQNTPILNQLAQLNNNIKLCFLLRDDNPEIMDAYLTNGGRSIPKLIALSNDLQHELFTWGPRPETAQTYINELRSQNLPHSELVLKAQEWYNADKTQSFQKEFCALLKSLA